LILKGETIFVLNQNMGGGFSRPCSGYGNGQCGCSTCLHAERTVGIYRDREPELVISSEPYSIPSTWIVNDHRAGKSEVCHHESEGITQGYEFGIQYSYLQSVISFGNSRSWTKSVQESRSHEIPPGFKGKIIRHYVKKTIRRRYFIIHSECSAAVDGTVEIDEPRVCENPDIIDVEYLVSVEHILIPLIKSHIYFGLSRKVDEKMNSFKNCTIVANHSRKYIDVCAGGKQVGTTIHQWDLIPDCANQRFTFSLVTEMAHKGYFICECCGDDKAIGVTGEIRAGSPLQVHDINTKSPKQIFRLEINYNDGDNYWCIISCDTDKNLVWEIEDESSKSGKRLILGRRTNNKNQRFCLNNGDSYK